MSGRFVVIKFDDPDAANAFVANQHIPKQLGFDVTAMFVLPTKFCDCPEKRGRKPGRVHLDNWARGKRTGIWLCRTCKRPSQYHNRGLLAKLEGIFGYNLIGREH